MQERFITAEERPITGFISGCLSIAIGILLLKHIQSHPKLERSLYVVVGLVVLFGCALVYYSLKGFLARLSIEIKRLTITFNGNTYNLLPEIKTKKKQPSILVGSRCRISGQITVAKKMFIDDFSVGFELQKREKVRLSVAHSFSYKYTDIFSKYFSIFKNETFNSGGTKPFEIDVDFPSDVQSSVSDINDKVVFSRTTGNLPPAFDSGTEIFSWTFVVKAKIKYWPDFKLIRDIQVRRKPT